MGRANFSFRRLGREFMKRVMAIDWGEKRIGGLLIREPVFLSL